ncbi:MAG: glutamate formimidoyltransferase [Candidatus Heimdallarchaeota archaeon]|nr:MAG: glutamate formimidoyltransferase [Candidatus Heimdallarchaeota archaeon]
MDKIIECVPNFSTSDPTVIKAITDVIEAVDEIKLLNVDPDIDYNRVVITFVGTPDSVGEAAFQGIAKATDLIDMRDHKGEHPRIGATDVCPFVPVKGVTDEECVQLARQLAEKVANELRVPTYLYAKAATSEERVRLPNIRKGEYEGLREKIVDPKWKPDFGAPVFNERSGAYVIGARDFLIAYNVNIDSEDVEIATVIGRTVRESGWWVEKDGQKVREPGLFKGIQGMGVTLERPDRKLTQVSMNVMNYREQTKPHEVFEEIKRLATEKGANVTGSEIVGLIPLEAILLAGKHYVPDEEEEDQLIKIAIDNLGLSDLDEFIPEQKIIELMIK